MSTPMHAFASPHHDTRPTSRTRPARRRSLYTLLHRLALWLTLCVGAGALVYNAVSIVNGDSGLIGLSQLLDDAFTESALSSRRG